jgi:heptosyltransferase I
MVIKRDDCRQCLTNLRHLCIVRLSALGDLVLTMPAVRALALRYPEARITWVVHRRFAPILRGLPPNVELCSLERLKGFGDYFALARRLRAHRFDALLAMQASLRSNLIYPLVRAPVKIGFNRRSSRDLHGSFVNRRIPDRNEHLCEGFLSFAAAVGAPPPDPLWQLPTDPSSVEWRERVVGTSDYIVVVPCASKPERDWLAERYVELLNEWRCCGGALPVLCAGQSERERDTAAFIAQHTGALNLTGQTDLPKLFALLAGAKVVVSPDSGPVHIARAYEVPVVGLYAVSRSARTGPYQRLEWTVDKFDDAVRRLLKREPSDVDWYDRLQGATAQQGMRLIQVRDVVPKLWAAYGGRRTAIITGGSTGGGASDLIGIAAPERQI